MQIKSFCTTLVWIVSIFILCAMPAVVAGESNHLVLAKPFGPSEAVPDPARASNGWYTSEAGVTETLFVLDLKMRLKPWLAESYRNLTPLTWEIKLKDGVVFHDNTPLDAAAVKWSIERLIDEKSDVFNKQVQGLLDIKKIDIKEKNLLIFETNQPNAAFVYNLVSPAAAILSPKSNAQHIYATGPFVLKKVIPSEQMEVEKFDNYWNGSVGLDSVTLKIIENPATRMLGFESGQLDMAVNFPETDAKRMAAKKGYEIVQAPTNRLCFFFVRVVDGPLKDARIRKAINHAINRKELVEAVLAGLGGEVGASIFPSGLPWHNAALTPYAYDPQKASTLLAEAGAKDTDGDGMLELDGKPLTLNMWTYEGRASLKPTLELVQVYLKQVGIASNLKVTKKGSPINEAMQQGEVQLNLQMWNAAPQGDPDYFISNIFTSKAAANYMGYHNVKLDELAQKGKSTFDPEKRKEIYDRIQKIIYEESPAIVLFHKSMVTALRSYVKNYEIHPAEKYLLTSRLSRQ